MLALDQIQTATYNEHDIDNSMFLLLTVGRETNEVADKLLEVMLYGSAVGMKLLGHNNRDYSQIPLSQGVWMIGNGHDLTMFYLKYKHLVRCKVPQEVMDAFVKDAATWSALNETTSGDMMCTLAILAAGSRYWV